MAEISALQDSMRELDKSLDQKVYDAFGFDEQLAGKISETVPDD